MPYQTYSSPYAAPRARRSSTGMLSGESKADSPFTNPILPKKAPTVFQVPPVGGNTGSASAALQGYTTTGPAQPGQVGSLLPITPPTVVPPETPSGPTPGFSIYDPTTDPIYQKITQLGKQQVSQAVAGGDALRKQLLIQLGDPTFAAQQQFGDPNSPVYGDANTTAAAAANPYSTLAGLLTTHTGNNASIDKTDNAAGGYYSSTHANQLADENTSYNKAITDADNNVGSQLSSIVQQILQTQNNAQSANISALDQATSNLIQSAIANGYTFEGYNPDGTPKFAAPASTGGGGSGGGGGGSTTATTSAPPEQGNRSLSPAAGYALNSGLLDAARQQAKRGVYGV